MHICHIIIIIVLALPNRLYITLTIMHRSHSSKHYLQHTQEIGLVLPFFATLQLDHMSHHHAHMSHHHHHWISNAILRYKTVLALPNLLYITLTIMDTPLP